MRASSPASLRFARASSGVFGQARPDGTGRRVQRRLRVHEIAILQRVQNSLHYFYRQPGRGCAKGPAVAKPIGNVLADARRRKGLTLQALSRVAKVDPSLISRLERGRTSDIRISVAARLCAALGLRLDDLVGGRRRAELPDRGPTYADLDKIRKALSHAAALLAEIAGRK